MDKEKYDSYLKLALNFHHETSSLVDYPSYTEHKYLYSLAQCESDTIVPAQSIVPEEKATE